MIDLEIVTPPASEPVALDRVKQHLRIEHGDEDVLLTAYLSAARLLVEDMTGRALAAQTIRELRDAFPEGAAPIELLRVPVTSVDEVRYVLADGTERVLDSSAYVVREERLVVPTSSWPTDDVMRVRITYKTGSYMTPVLEQAVAWMAALMYEQRLPIITGAIVRDVPMPLGLRSLLSAEKRYIC